MAVGQRSEPTKEAIKVAAERLFRERGLAGTNLREIAAAAGVNHALVIRYFGSKEGLFLEVITVTAGLAGLTALPLEAVGRELVRWALRARQENRLGTYAVLLVAAERHEVRQRFQDYVASELVPRLAARSTAEDAVLRAHVFAAQFLGVVSTLALDLDPQLHLAPPEKVVEICGDALQLVLTPAAS